MSLFKKYDIIIVLVIIIFAAMLWVLRNNIYSNQTPKAEIYYKSELVKTIDLNTGIDKHFTVPQNDDVVFHLYKDGSIAFEESDCPDKICIKSGKLNRVGESAACLPNELFLKIVPENDNGTDGLDMIIGR